MNLVRMQRLSLTVLLTLIATSAAAHSEMERPLFVAAGGDDKGNCVDASAPCASLAYALTRVGKGGEIRVAEGAFAISDPGDLFHLISGIVNVRGGFSQADGFREAGVATTTITGVPPEYRGLFSNRGFHVLADSKNQPEEQLAKTHDMLRQHKSMQAPLKSAPCVNGETGGLACENIELLAHVPFASVSANPRAAADVWGFVDLNTDREYAITSYNSGTAVFDITEPTAPREVGFIDGQNTTWRDIKVYQAFDTTNERWAAYAYITTDGSTDGLFIIDLSELPQRVRRVNYPSDFSAAHNVFSANTDYGTGLALTDAGASLIVAGSNNGGGLFRPYSLANPAAPAFTGTPPGSTADYMHDAATMIIRDARKDTQCQNATDYCEVLFDFNETTVDIWDITVPASAVRLSRTPYNNARYTHSGWPSEDGQFLFVHDELDERDLNLATTLRIFSLADLTAPTLMTSWTGPTRAIDHNGFVRGNRYYMSNYSRGLTVLDITNPTQPQLVAHLDTYPFSDNPSFVGAWGAYPYFHSGTIAVSDISSGLYLVADNSLDGAAGSLSFTSASFGGTEGASATIGIQRQGGSSGAVSTQLQLVPATASDSDLTLGNTTVSWADGESGVKTVQIAMNNDADAEALEFALLKLVAPSGGASLQPASVARVYVAEAGSAASVQFAQAELDASERGFGMAVVTLQRSGTAVGAISVDYSLSAGDAQPGTDFQGATSGTVSWADGDAAPKTLEFIIADDNTAEADEFFELSLAAPQSASIGSQATTKVNILNGTGVNNPPNAVAGASQSVSSGASVTLTGSASNDADGDTLTYAWTQTLGPQVSLNNADQPVASFQAPTVTSGTLLQFQLRVSDSGGLDDTASTNVTVNPAGNSNTGSGGGGGGHTGWLLPAALLGAYLRRRRVSRTDAV